ncbi:MAG: ATP-binding cassette domain-containing protein [Deltaproteobacteria bacterium]|nr:ATP-binding cassette domain-containing protein [Deltaproteobacteria bacterium]
MDEVGSTIGASKGAPPDITRKLGLYSRVLAYLKPYKVQFSFALLCMIFYGASDGAVPFLVKSVLDGVFTEKDASLLKLLPIALVLFAIIRAITDFGQQYLMARVGHWIVRDIRNDFNSHVLKLSPDFFIANSGAQLVSGITSDVVLIRGLLTDTVAAVLRDAIRVVALLISAFYLDPTLALIAFVVFPIGIWPVYRFGRKLRKLSMKGQHAIGSLSAMMSESMVGNRVVKIFGREDFERRRFERENQDLTNTFIRSEKVRAISGPINEVLASFAISGVILYGGYSVLSGVRSQGDFIAFLISVFLLYDPFKKLSRVNGTIQQGLAGAQRIFDVLDTKPRIQDPLVPQRLGDSNKIEFEEVFFSYRPIDSGTSRSDEPQALADITLSIEEGSKVALVGFSGAGKSTLVDLIPRYMDPQQGVIRIGGVDISSVRLADLRARIAMVGQHTFLFNDTVSNNIAYGNPAATQEEIVKAAQAAYADTFIRALPQGYDTKLGEGGLTLSGGERQRLAIARALLKNAPILILDEATASLDNRSEREVQSALESLEKGRTSIVIAHRLSTVRDADCVVVLSDGRIVEMGTHDELLKRNGAYAKLHALQFAPKENESGLDETIIN